MYMYHVLCKLKYSRWIHFCEFHKLVCNHKMKVRLLCMVVHGTDSFYGLLQKCVKISTYSVYRIFPAGQ